MHSISKKLNLSPLDTVKLIEIEEKIEKTNLMTIDDYRNLLSCGLLLSRHLITVCNMPMHEAIAIVKKNKFTCDMYYEMISELKEYIEIL